MALDKKLNAWIAAGLIDAATAERIRAHEVQDEKPFVLWAIAGLGLLALALGIMSLVAAHWDEIADGLKLGVHLLLTGAATAAVWLGCGRGNRWLADGAIFVLGAVVLAGIALQSQIYQLTGPLWQALLMWLVLMTPVALLAGSTRLSAYGWSLMAMTSLAAVATDMRDDQYGLVVQGFAMAGPAMLIAMSFLRAVGRGVEFRVGMREIGFIGLLGGASIAHFGWADSVDASTAHDMLLRLILPAVAALVAWQLGVRSGETPRAMLLPLTMIPTVAGALALALPHPDSWMSRFVGALIFATMWGLVARAASLCGWRTLFGIAIAAIAIRIFIVYFELFGTLATTGAGLIVAGLLLIGLAALWRRILRLEETA